MRRRSFYFLALMLLLLIINIGIFINREKSFPPEPHNFSVEAPHRYMGYPVYFVGQNRLVEIRQKSSVLWRNKYQNIADIYLKQGELEIQARPQQIMNIPINQLIVKEDEIFVHTQLSAFRESRYNRGNFQLYLMSFVNSLTEEGRGKTVYFIFDGNTKAPNLYGVDMNQGFKYDSSLVAEKYGFPDLFIRQFFLDMYSGDYRSAYRKISREAREIRWTSDFYSAFENYVFHRNNEFPWDFVLEKTKEGYDVTVYFAPDSINEPEHWSINLNYGMLTINYSQELLDHLP